ncbi:50S ribosomal protein L11 methyltransferase [Lactobacillus sp. ESL0681]|uniref:50S ribosomal protein L11 methyltransferase n=1 Tax=Lactobacillus sp. ESL0681 TaxID=2983211 RepID=UPI0023F9EE13|nr:50S ribosomal protein L11 methyltransferase [Lactobacillus sp. ESL0681]WEV40735.1 50S ribosomal protein L11 methyltransferase [Lactobacillus sp. ESL0681]
MKLLMIKIETSHEVEDALTIYSMDDLHALGTQARKRSDFQDASRRHDSTLVELDEIQDLPKDMQFIAYFDEEADATALTKSYQSKLQELQSYGLAIGQAKLTTSYVVDQDWNTAWQKFYHPIDFSRHLAIVPEWEDYQPAFADQKLIKLDPGLAFGTGNHITTQLVLTGLELVMAKPKSVIDVGTGSGILAIAATLLGAKQVSATDISDEAISATHQNMKLNKLSEINVQKTSLLTGVTGKFDVIVANILADILLELIPQLDEHLNIGGQVIFSGIDYLQLSKVHDALDQAGFKVVLSLKKERWVGLIIERQE